MTVLTDLLPMLEGWSLETQQIVVPFTIAAGGARTLFEKTGYSGYVLGLVASSNQPLTTLELRHVGPTNQERLVSGSPFTLNALGLTLPNGSGFWNSVFNAVLGIYVGCYSPDSRIGWWDDYIRVRILAPAAVPTTINYYSHSIVWISDEKLWRESIRELLHGEK